MQVIMGGESEFKGLIYGDSHPGTLSFLQSQIGGGFRETLTEAGRQMFTSLGGMFEQFNGDNVLRLAKAARRKITGMFQQDVIKPLESMDAIQQATLKMQRWVMAMPDIRRLHIEQRCDGYSTSYLDMHPGVVGEKHYDYRRVMNGLYTETPDGGTSVVYYYDDVPDADPELSLQDKLDITRTWDFIKYSLETSDQDPTSIYNERL